MNEYGRDAEVEDFDLEGNKGLSVCSVFWRGRLWIRSWVQMGSSENNCNRDMLGG